MKHKHKQKTPAEIRLELMLKATQVDTPEKLQKRMVKYYADENVVLGERIAVAICAMELMMYWEASREDIRDFLRKYQEFVEVYDEDDEEGQAELWGLFKKLEEKVGYSVVDGLIEDPVEEGK